MNADWPFADPEETDVITLERILRGDSAILLVTHDRDEGGWQFLDGEQVFEEDGVLVSLGEIVHWDPSLERLADLPEGWYAWRPAPSASWQRGEGEAPDAAALGPAALDDGS